MARPTRFAASNEPLFIYQDEFQDENHGQSAPSISRAPMPSVGRQPSPRRPLQNSNGNLVLNTPYGHRNHQSPYKASGPSSVPPFWPSQNRKLNTIDIKPPTLNAPATDSMPKKPLMSTFKTANPRQASVDKENMHPGLYCGPYSLNVEQYYQNNLGKRALLEAAPITESKPSKKAKIDEPSLPDPSSFPPIYDDGTKPGHSYAQLIGMAILRAPHRKLTLSQIYKWISDNYKFYSATDAGWQNSIRHNLSLNKAFIKQERPKDDPGKGNYWAIEPGMEQQFMKEKPSRKATAASENMHIMSMAPSVDYSQFETCYPHDGVLPPLPSVPQAQATPYPQAVSQPPAISAPELSSDATILLSDNACSEEVGDKAQEPDAPLPTDLASPLPPAMHSSPPMPRFVKQQSDTPPTSSARKMLWASSRGQKRKHLSMDASISKDDSGYISSLESSALRQQPNPLYSSGTKHPRVKGGLGRAENEIRRLRHSSYDSPTKSRSHGTMPISSSPSRNSNHGQMPPPLTPVVKMRPPPKPTASVSPNTSLQAHRDDMYALFESPLRRVSNISNNIANMPPCSPSLAEDPMNETNIYGLDWWSNGLPGNDFSFFDDVALNFPGSADPSPLKRSAKRPRIDRSHSTSALGDITNSALRKSITSAPFLRVPSPPATFGYESPSKAFEGMSSPCKTFLQSPVPTTKRSLQTTAKDSDWPNFENSYGPPHFHEDTEVVLDIAQGFEKIGSGSLIRSWKEHRPSDF
ncbi:hypothetical protein HD806DRAFT_518121 [Xylariaceae sp. AK1471]|nr:hypothetical protein HD806DRAFT_518121 [Xylariaceae sp. AK1471]